MKKHILLLCLTLIMALSALPALAEEEVIDFSKLSCADINEAADRNERLHAILWLDGYLSAESGSAVANDAWYEALLNHIEQYCTSHEDTSLIEAAHQMADIEIVDGTDSLDTTCSEVLTVAENEEAFGAMLMWIDGYVSFKSKSGVLTETWFENTATQLINYCSENESATLGNVIEGLSK